MCLAPPRGNVVGSNGHAHISHEHAMPRLYLQEVVLLTCRGGWWVIAHDSTHFYFPVFLAYTLFSFYAFLFSPLGFFLGAGGEAVGRLAQPRSSKPDHHQHTLIMLWRPSAARPRYTGRALVYSSACSLRLHLVGRWTWSRGASLNTLAAKL